MEISDEEAEKIRTDAAGDLVVSFMTAFDQLIKDGKVIGPAVVLGLASLVGASRERVNKAIASFERLGWLSQSGRQYVITERVELERRSR